MVKVTTLNLPGFDPLEFFSKLGDNEKHASYFTSGEWIIVAWNPVTTVKVKNAHIFRALEKANRERSRRYTGDLPFVGGTIGYLDYDVEKRGGAFHCYDRVLLFHGTNIFAIGDRKYTEEIQQIHARNPVPLSVPDLQWKASITRAKYARKFKKIQTDIRNGEYYQLNLTYTLDAFSDCDRRRLFCSLLRANPASCASYFENGKRSILSLSPERFVTIDWGQIVTCPIKGTRPRGDTPKKDQRLQQELLASEKEAAELSMITDLLRNDIGHVSTVGSVRVIGHRLLQKNPTVWHTYSVIEGKLLPALHPMRALQSMFPGGSITGCPKRRAMQRIRELEERDRGPYCGSMLMQSDHGFLDSTILIRTIVAKGKHFSLGIGGGIVADSNIEDEWQETKQKAKAFLGDGRRVWINGRKVSPDDRRLALLNPSNPHAYGIFETMLMQKNRIDQLDAHRRRLRASAKILGMKLPRSLVRLRTWLDQVCTENPFQSARLKLVCTETDVLIELMPLRPDPKDYTGISVTFVETERALPEGKILPYTREWSAHEKARNKGYDEALLRNRLGYVPEAAFANIFWVKDGALSTADRGMLPGITRARILSIAKKLKIPVRFSLPTKDELLGGDEIFLTKSTTGITPVLRIDRTIIGSGKRGPITEALMQRLFSATLPPT